MDLHWIAVGQWQTLAQPVNCGASPAVDPLHVDDPWLLSSNMEPCDAFIPEKECSSTIDHSMVEKNISGRSADVPNNPWRNYTCTTSNVDGLDFSLPAITTDAKGLDDTDVLGLLSNMACSPVAVSGAIIATTDDMIEAPFGESLLQYMLRKRSETDCMIRGTLDLIISSNSDRGIDVSSLDLVLCSAADWLVDFEVPQHFLIGTHVVYVTPYEDVNNGRFATIVAVTDGCQLSLQFAFGNQNTIICGFSEAYLYLRCPCCRSGDYQPLYTLDGPCSYCRKPMADMEIASSRLFL
jgi:hypothetical protein